MSGAQIYIDGQVVAPTSISSFHPTNSDAANRYVFEPPSLMTQGDHIVEVRFSSGKWVKADCRHVAGEGHEPAGFDVISLEHGHESPTPPLTAA